MTRGWSSKGAATGFDEEEWYLALRNATRIEELVSRHEAVMDRWDPQRKVGLVVDEWGTWWDVEPGTNPGFLYQQNTLRDALVAAVHLDTFHRHAARVVMANIAQTVNVLQAMILTDPETGALVLTPSYHVFAMNRAHHDAASLAVTFKGEVPVRQVAGEQPGDALGVRLDARRHGAGLAVEPRRAASGDCRPRPARPGRDGPPGHRPDRRRARRAQHAVDHGRRAPRARRGHGPPAWPGGRTAAARVRDGGARPRLTVGHTAPFHGRSGDSGW